MEERESDLREDLYRQSRYRDKRGLAEEIAKFSLCFALSEHDQAATIKGRRRTTSGTDVAGIKAGILSEKIRSGDEVEGEAIASEFTALYKPRAYYTSYFLGEMRAALRRGDSPPSASPHYLPVSVMPSLPDGSGINFLYPPDREAFDRFDFPAGTRDVLTRDYLRMPLLIPPGEKPLRGVIGFRARVLRLSRDSLGRLAGLGEKSYDAYSTRGLTYFLQPLEIDGRGGGVSLRGSLFAEIFLPEEPEWDEMVGVLEEAVCGTVEQVFPECPRGERQGMGCYLPHTGFHAVKFRRKLFALVYDPVIVVYRAPRLLGLFLPCDLMAGMGGHASLFELFVMHFAATLRSRLGLSSSPGVEIAYDNMLPWARDGGALRGPAFHKVEEAYPFLKRTLHWLRGD